MHACLTANLFGAQTTTDLLGRRKTLGAMPNPQLRMPHAPELQQHPNCWLSLKKNSCTVEWLAGCQNSEYHPFFRQVIDNEVDGTSKSSTAQPQRRSRGAGAHRLARAVRPMR
jgi:hypothetical protein